MSFFDIQRAARSHFEQLGDRYAEKGSGFKQYMRWEWFWEQRVWATGKFPLPEHNWNEWTRFVGANGEVLAKSASSAGNWRPMGPSEVPSKGNDGLGRLNCIAFHPTDPNTFYVGAPAGGLWKTTDFGNTWQCNTDQLPVLGVSDIAIDPVDPNIMYIATGDGDMGSLSGIQTDQRFVDGDTRSVGVLRTTNGGATWGLTGLRFDPSELVLIRRLHIDPSDRLTLLAASSIGVLRTSDGGASWRIVEPGFFMDLEYHPTNPSVVYATTAALRGDPSAFFRSDDGGRTWEKTAQSSGILRMKIGVTPQRPNRVDILCASLRGGLAAIFTSADEGREFNPTGYQPDSTRGRSNLLGWYNGLGDDFLGGQGQYDLAYAISPNNAAEMYVGGINTWRTTDGGGRWDLANFWSAYPSDSAYNRRYALAHADKHFLRFHPLRPEYLFECNDGGLWYSSDRGTSWTNISSGLQIGQPYRVASSPHEVNTVLAGHQDNATWMLDQGVWRQAGIGDGMEVAVDPVDRNTMYRVGQEGSIFRSRRRLLEFADHSKLDMNELNGMFLSGNIPGYGPVFKGAWLTPFVIDPVNSNVLYTAMYHVWRSSNQGDSWSAISGLSVSGERRDQNGNPIPLHIRTLAVSPVNPNIIWAGTFEDVVITVDGGLSWFNYANRPSQTIALTGLVAHPFNQYLCFGTLSGYEAGAKVFVLDLRTGGGENLSFNLPNVPVNCLVYDHRNGGGLFVGTDIGVFYLNLAVPGSVWQPFNDGLPRAVVTDLDIQENAGLLRAATFGRGVWESDLFGPAQAEPHRDAPQRSWSVRTAGGGTFELMRSSSEVDAVIIYDYLGRVVTELPLSEERTLLDLGRLPVSIYYAALRSEGYRHLEKIVRHP